MPANRGNVVVIGAGFSGLVAAWRLQKDGFQVTIVESKQDVGGMIKTEGHRLGLVETAANGLLCSRLVEELFTDCGVELFVPKKSSRRRFLAVNGNLSRFPLSMLEALKTLIKISQFRKYPPEPSESLGNWAERALGKPMAEKIVAPGVLGIYAADSKDLSANLIVGRFFEKVKRRNIRGKIKGTVSAQEGLGALLQSLRMTLSSRGVIFEFGADGGEALRRAGQNKTPAVLATSAWAACEILRSQQRVAREDLRIKALSEIRSIPLISVTVFFRTPPDKVGFGTLFAQNLPVGENDGILGCLQNSEIFEGRVRGESATHSETWILGGVSRGVELIELADAALLEMIILKRSKMIDPDSREKIVDTRFTRWPRAIPLYSPSLEAAVPLLKVDREGVLLFGNYLGELGLASILENSIELKSRLEKL